MVTTHNIDENQMGNRGSKPVLVNNLKLNNLKDAEKEQRVDGSRCINRVDNKGPIH